MTINYEALRNWPFPERVDRYTANDSMLYALGVGYGSDPCLESELPFVQENNTVAVPTILAVIGAPNAWAADSATGIDYLKLLHGEHRMTFHAPIRAAGAVRSTTRVSAVIDKGQDKGALVVTQRDIADADTGTALASIEHVSFCRADGGFGNGDASIEPLPDTPARQPDRVIEFPTTPQSALLYRLNGDWNPVHISPATARAAGFERPILHGLCSFGMAARAVIRASCNGEPDRLKSFSTRFSAPMYPGETLRVEIWDAEGAVHFRALAQKRNKVVLSSGYAHIGLPG